MSASGTRITRAAARTRFTRAAARTRFTVPPELSADRPPEARGVARDGVRLLVAEDGHPVRHHLFTDLPAALAPGDLLVVNTSTTEPAAVDARRADGRSVVVHVSGPNPAGDGYVVELRSVDGGRVSDGRAGETLTLPGGVTVRLDRGYPDRRTTTGSRLWTTARIPVEGGIVSYLDSVGRPIRYSYLDGQWPVEDYRTVVARRSDAAVPALSTPHSAPFSTPPSSDRHSDPHSAPYPAPDSDPAGIGRAGTVPEFAGAEMPSAARPLSPAVLDGLLARGVGLAEIVLHAGVSSPEADEVPLPERYRVPEATAAAVAATRSAGGRVVAVGTTVTRALETVASPDGTVRAGAGWTDLVLGPDRPVRVVDGLVTGWHEPEASHLLLLEAVAGPRLVGRAYRAAVAHRYLWHEFGDSCLLLPGRRAQK